MPIAPARRDVVTLFAVATLLPAAAVVPAAARAAESGSGSSLEIVAHPDDDLLFQSPDLSDAIAAGRTVTTAYVTGGDAGGSATYWKGRENGAKAAYAKMAGVANAWTSGTVTVAGKTVATATLTGRPSVTLVFFRLPDGNLDGSGFSATGYTSLAQLDQGSVASITALDGSATWTRSSLLAGLLALMTRYQPDRANTLDYVGGYGDGDHADHHAVAFFTRSASEQYTRAHTLVGYRGYGIAAEDPNLTAAQISAKSAVFYTYASYDPSTCSSAGACAGKPEASWLQRQYTVRAAPTEPTPSGTNLARQATATASSENFSTGQTAAAAIDGVVDGYPGDSTREWATVWEGAGATLTLTWPSAVTTDTVVLFDRPNADDRITSGRITFSDGSTVDVPSLANDGSAVPVAFAARSITSLTFTVLSVSSTTANVGLAELQVLQAAGDTTPQPTSGTNIAGQATVTASSENASTSQLAVKAVDGALTGYPDDYTTEWATVGGGAGSWLNLAWSSAKTVNSVVLYDRPNADDQITSATLTFSDGSVVTVPSLTNDGSAVTVSFTPRSTTSVRLDITGVSSTTSNVGLAEIAVFAS